MFHSIWSCLALDIHVLPRTPTLDRLFRLITNPNFHRVYLQKYSGKEIKLRYNVPISILPYYSKFHTLKPHQKKIGSKNAKMPSLKETNPQTILL